MTDLLLVDMGNTRLKWVVSRGQTIDESSLGRGTQDQCIEAIQTGSYQLEYVLLSSVAGEGVTADFERLCQSHLGLSVRRLRSEKQFAGIENGYADASALGVDRWLAIVGAAHEHGMPVVVMDLGTATTLDAVNEAGNHLGGLILPGPALMLDSLDRATAMTVPRQFKTAGDLPRNFGVGPARSTSSAIQEGVYAAQMGALNQFIKNVSSKLDAEPQLVLTGGAAEGILGRLEQAPVYDPLLVFKGILLHRK